MQDNFSSETELVNKLRLYLQNKNFHIVQLVSPGGQAHLSVTFSHDNTRRTVYPDLIAVENNVIWIGEVKEKFDCTDHDKLLVLKQSDSARRSILRNVHLRLREKISGPTSFKFVLIHSEYNSQIKSSISELVLAENDLFDERSPSSSVTRFLNQQ